MVQPSRGFTAPDYHGAHLRHVLTSAAAAVNLPGFSNHLGVPESSIAVIILADGLGHHNLAAHSGHARFLSRAWRSSEHALTLDTGAPTTTATSLASLGTGLVPGEHGLVGYDVYAPHLDRVVNMLGRWDPAVDPKQWQEHTSVLHTAHQAGAKVLTVSRPQFRDSGLTRAALAGGEFTGASRIESRFAATAEWISHQRPRSGQVRRGPAAKILVYLYVDELDKTGHSDGVGSPRWRNMLESLDAASERFCTQLRRDFGDHVTVLLTADHGMVNVAEDQRIDISGMDHLLNGVRHTAGEPRCVQLHTEPGAAEGVAQNWERAFGDRVVVTTRTHAVAEGWFGTVSDHLLPRIGDVLVAARDDLAIFHTERNGTSGLSMVGQHGSLTEVERRVPLVELTGRPIGAAFNGPGSL